MAVRTFLVLLFPWQIHAAVLCERGQALDMINQIKDSEAPFHTLYLRPMLAALFADCGWNETHFGLPGGTLRNSFRRTAHRCYRRLGHELVTLPRDAEPHTSLQDFELWKTCLDHLNQAGQPPRLDMNMAEAIERRFKKALSNYAQERQGSCTEKSVATLPGLERVRDQGNAGWCFAHTAADLASVHFGKKISAVDLALSHHDQPPSLEFFRRLWSYSPAKFASGGWSERALEKGAERGFCLEENFRSDAGGQAAFVSLYRELHEAVESNMEINPRDLRSLYVTARTVAPKISFTDFVAAIRHPDRDNFFNRFRDKACAPRLQGRVPTEASTGSIVGSLDSALNQGAPASIGYYYQCTEDRDKFEGRHASTVVARRFNRQSNVCEYLVRNSWGEEFQRGDAPPGHFWISEQRIKRCAYSAVELRRPGPAAQVVTESDIAR